MPTYPVAGPKPMIDRIVTVVARMDDVTITRDDDNTARLHWSDKDISAYEIADRVLAPLRNDDDLS